MYKITRSNKAREQDSLKFSNLSPGRVYIVTDVPTGHNVNIGEAAVRAGGYLAFLTSSQWSGDVSNFLFSELQEGETVTITG